MKEKITSFVEKLVKNVWFYVGFVVMIGLIIFFSKEKVAGYVRFPARMVVENIDVGSVVYIPKRQITDVILGVTYGNINAGEKQNVSTKSIDIKNFDEIMYLLQEMEYLAKTNIGNMLKYSSDRERTVKLHMKQIKTKLDSAETLLHAITNELQYTQLDYAACKANKEQADNLYKGGINTNNGSMISIGYQEAQQYGQCMTDKRIRINTYAPIRKKLLTYQKALQKQYDFLEQNMAILLTNYDLFAGEKLKQLMHVKNVIDDQ